MKCPTCNKEMELFRQDTSRSKQQEKSYDRKVYACSQDDIGITVETPQENAVKEPLAAV